MSRKIRNITAIVGIIFIGYILNADVNWARVAADMERLFSDRFLSYFSECTSKRYDMDELGTVAYYFDRVEDHQESQQYYAQQSQHQESGISKQAIMIPLILLCFFLDYFTNRKIE